MIGKLRGVVDSIGTDWAIIDVGGVGYLVHCSTPTLQALAGIGEPATLAIETHVREDEIRLFGFSGEAERELFRLLHSVQGVGARLALAILGALKPAELASAIALQDKAMVARAPGVGQKLAGRICAELKDKAPAFTAADPALARFQTALGDRAAPQPASDAVSALVNLGYGQAQASAAVATAMRAAGEEAETAALIRLGLKELAR
ncbi:MAG TPA: Holliday junction branch migration protein RuvA [Afifellaceae bacterium]|nr:Holliday junction branch migration protein RuvA [Afifellaceae bacterium]